ncbi:hypothetical protein HQ447_05595 [bacterium]|nr:hypothetical protein [bacterium]
MGLYLIAAGGFLPFTPLENGIPEETIIPFAFNDAFQLIVDERFGSQVAAK